jgi:hypothetical protein
MLLLHSQGIRNFWYVSVKNIRTLVSGGAATISKLIFKN